MHSVLRYCLAASLLGGSLAARAQAPDSAAVAPASGGQPRTQVHYYNAQGHKVPAAQAAGYRIEITQIDSVQSQERVFYPSGKLKSFRRYLTVRRDGRRHSVSYGRSLEYYESGQLHVQTDQPTKSQAGERLVYYPDGKLRRRDKLPLDGPTTGECFGPDGQPVAYHPYQIMPVYSEGDGGQQAIVMAIQQRVRYPAEALRNRLAGRVFVRFQVDKTGHVRDPRVVGGVDESKFSGSALDAVRQLEATVLQAVSGLGSFRPGQRDGEPEAVMFTVPITFKLQ